jgi:hypothetical protein
MIDDLMHFRLALGLSQRDDISNFLPVNRQGVGDRSI